MYYVIDQVALYIPEQLGKSNTWCRVLHASRKSFNRDSYLSFSMGGLETSGNPPRHTYIFPPKWDSSV